MTPEAGILIYDSITAIGPDDAGRVLVGGSHGGVFVANLAARGRLRAVILADAGEIVVTGSHGGLLGGRVEAALKAPALAAVFNDAGAGIDDAGIGRLAARGIAAATVGHETARIGDGLSTWRDGVVSHVNRVAAAAGAEVGLDVPAWVARIASRERSDQL